MRASERVLRSNRVVLPEGIRAAAIVVRDGVIAKIIEHKAIPCDEVIDFEDSVIMPGIVDTHVHINEPGRTEWEGFETATMAAAAGGVTTLIDMPLNSIPATTTIAAFREKVAFAQGKLFVDVGFWGGMIPGNVAELSRMYGEGVFGFKCFLIASGVPEFEALSESELRLAFTEKPSDRDDYYAKPTNHPSMGSVLQYLGIGRQRGLPGYVCLPAFPGHSQGLRRAIMSSADRG